MNSKELAELIHQNTRIILPEFGAFLVKDSGDKGFNPSNVSFSPFLRYNDGMMEVYVAKSRGISKEEAAKDVHEFVETIKNELLEKGFYEVESLGSLKRDQRGSLSFSLTKVENTEQPEKASTEQLPPKKEVIAEPPLEIEKNDKQDVWLEEDKPQVEEEPKKTKTRKISGSKAKVEKLTVTKKAVKTPKIVEEIQQEPVKEAPPETIIESIPDTKPEVVPTPQNIAESVPEQHVTIIPEEKIVQVEEPKYQEEKLENPIPPEKEIKKKGSGIRLIYTIIILVVVVSMFFIIRNYYFPPKIDTLNDSLTSIKKPEKIINEKIEVKDKIDKPKDDIDKTYNELANDKKKTKEQAKKEEAQEESIKNTLIKNTQIKNTDNKSNQDAKFYIIAGSFKNPSFAEKFLNEMNKSGYNASIIVQPSGMNTVAIGSYSTREEANAAMKNYKSKLPNLWILKK